LFCAHPLGTPLQNNLRELWALLFYLYPSISDPAPFENGFTLNATPEQKQAVGSSISNGILVNRDTLEKAHYLMRVLMLRR